MKRRQLGVSLSGLMMASVIIAIVALVGIKVMPVVVEYFEIVKALKKIKNDPNATSVAEVRRSFERYAVVDNIRAIQSQDLEVTKDEGEIVISFAYEQRVPLMGNVSLLFDFHGTTAKD